MIAIKTIPEQLTDIYNTYETWHDIRMDYETALRYHTQQYYRGNIYVHLKDDEVVGYYQREYNGNMCFLMNVWVKPSECYGEVFKELYRHFFKTMPRTIEFIVGEKVKLGKKWMRHKIIKRR